MVGQIEVVNNAGARGLRPTMVSLRLQVLAFIRDYIARWDQSPSLGEIAAVRGISRQHARRHVQSLVAAGLLHRVPGPRGLMLPDQAESALRVLRRQGWRVDEAAQVTNRPLPAGPAIHYVPLAKHSGAQAHGGQQAGKTILIP